MSRFGETMSEQNKKDITSLFGGREKIIEQVVQAVSTLCSVRQWTGEMLARKAFPETARAAATAESTDRVYSEFSRIKGVAESIISGNIKVLPSRRYVLAFLDVLGIPLQSLLALSLSDEERRLFGEQIKALDIKKQFAGTGEVPPLGEGRSVEMLIALNALSLACEPDETPSPEELQRRQATRARIRGILGLESTRSA